VDAADEDAKSGGSRRNLIIAVVLLVLMCCCVFGLIIILITIDTWVKEDLIEGLSLSAAWIFRSLTYLIN
jgi:hypothetical protein